MTTVLHRSSEWIEFHVDPELYLSAHRITPADLLLDILQQLWLDDVPHATKQLLLSALDEMCWLLVADLDAVEQVIGSLTQLFSSTTDVSLCSRVLVATTSVIIQTDVVTHKVNLFCTFVDILLGVIAKVNVVATIELRNSACACLEELEFSYPGILRDKIEHLYQMCHFERTACYQAYAMLFTTILDHVLASGIGTKKHIKNSYFSDMLLQRTEPLKPFHSNFLSVEELEEKLISVCSRRSLDLIDVGRNSRDDFAGVDVDTIELRKAVAFLINNSHVCTPPSVSRLLLQCLHIVATFPDLQANIFKSALIRYLPTHDTSIFYDLLVMRHILGQAHISESEDEMIFDRLSVLAIHPALTAAHRLLVLRWVSTSLSASLPAISPLYPKVFDGLDTHLCKVFVLLCHNRWAQETEGDVNSAFVTKLLRSLVDPVRECGVPGRIATTLFRALYLIYINVCNDDISNICSTVILSLLKCHAKLSSHAINFLDCIQATGCERGIADSHHILTELVDYSVTVDGERLSDMMSVITRASLEPKIDLVKILKYLNLLLANVKQEKCKSLWHVGNQMMGVCRNILLTHDTSYIFQDFADLLFQIMSSYDDATIADGARFYYGLLMRCCDEKMKLILSPSELSTAPYQLASFVTGNASFPSAQKIIELNDNIFVMEPLGNIVVNDVIVDGKEEIAENMSDDDIISSYYHWLATGNAGIVNKKYCVSLDEKLASQLTGPVLAIEISVLASATCDVPNKVSGWIASCKNGDRHVVDVCLQPVLPLPTELDVKATFTVGTSTYACYLPPLTINIQAFFLPLPVPTHLEKCVTRLSYLLWKKFHHHHSPDISSEFTHSLCNIDVAWDIFLEKGRKILDAFRLLLEDKTKTDVISFCIFLPPSSHVFLDMSPSHNQMKTLTNIYTDNINLLPFMNLYLKEIFS